MCGIVGIVHAAPAPSAERSARVRAMADALRHRGPDGDGLWSDPGALAVLGHRRLAIVDLSPEGHQPMLSASGRWVITFNGEIYNHRALRTELPDRGRSLRGRSDTEVLLAAVEAWGPREALRRAVGMFAFVLWDRHAREAWMVRDRMGEKPLYYAALEGGVAFASELDALMAHPELERHVDPKALGMLLRLGYVPAPHAILRGVRKLPAGSLLHLRAAADAQREPERYWDLAEVAVRGAERPFRGTPAEAAEAVEARLDAAVAEQMLADVPLGAFLSGGIDSSTVVALMQRRATRPVRTFTIGFDDPAHDEIPHARAIARHLRTEHTELRATASHALDLVPELPALYDEPLSDYSQLPTCILARLTKEHVTVSLSADGGDELFAGYHTYRWAGRLGALTRRMPGDARAAAPALARALEGAFLRLGPRVRRHPIAHRALRAASLLEAADAESVFRRLTRHWEGVAWPLPAVSAEASDVRPDAPPAVRSTLARMRLLDARSYLPEDVLVKVDRACMAASLESRAPLLDHRVVELAWTLPDSLLVGRDGGKQPLRRILARHVPRKLWDRPKMGFSPPLGAWLRGPLRPWAEALLAPARLDWLDPEAVNAVWRSHLAGERDWKFLLWDVLSFQAWWEAHRR